MQHGSIIRRYAVYFFRTLESMEAEFSRQEETLARRRKSTRRSFCMLGREIGLANLKPRNPLELLLNLNVEISLDRVGDQGIVALIEICRGAQADQWRSGIGNIIDSESPSRVG
jgi:hypothetical protein